MSERSFHALGTASQVPTRKRNHNGYFLRWDEEGFLFDPGEGTQRQMIFADVAMCDVTRICITHFHGDHCLGLPGVLQRASLDRVPHSLEVFYPASGRSYLERLRHASIYEDVCAVVPREITQPGVVFETADLSLSTARLDHRVDSWGYRIDEPDSFTLVPEKLQAAGLSGPLVGVLQRDGRVVHDGKEITLADVGVPRPGQSFAFVMDTRLCDAAFELARGVDVLVAESTYLTEHEREAKERGHLTAAQAARIAQEAGAGLLVLTHFSQRYAEEGDFLGEALEIHPEVVAVSDGDVVPFPRRRRAVEG